MWSKFLLYDRVVNVLQCVYVKNNFLFMIE